MFEIIKGHDSLGGSAFIVPSFERPRLRMCLNYVFPWLVIVPNCHFVDRSPPRSIGYKFLLYLSQLVGCYPTKVIIPYNCALAEGFNFFWSLRVKAGAQSLPLTIGYMLRGASISSPWRRRIGTLNPSSYLNLINILYFASYIAFPQATYHTWVSLTKTRPKVPVVV